MKAYKLTIDSEDYSKEYMEKYHTAHYTSERKALQAVKDYVNSRRTVGQYITVKDIRCNRHAIYPTINVYSDASGDWGTNYIGIITVIDIL